MRTNKSSRQSLTASPYVGQVCFSLFNKRPAFFKNFVSISTVTVLCLKNGFAYATERRRRVFLEQPVILLQPKSSCTQAAANNAWHLQMHRCRYPSPALSHYVTRAIHCSSIIGILISSQHQLPSSTLRRHSRSRFVQTDAHQFAHYVCLTQRLVRICPWSD